MDQLVEKTGVPRSTIAAFETGKRPLPADHRAALEKFFGVEIVETTQTQPAPKTGEEIVEPYKVRKAIWMDAPNNRLEELLEEYAAEKDWGAVKEITTELLNRKITDKLKRKTS